MIDLTQQEISARWDILPAQIREVIFDDTTTTLIENISKEEHLPEEKIGDVSRVTGFILCGFLHPEEMPKELIDELQVDSRIADAITQKINTRVFAPIRTALDAAYRPSSRLETLTAQDDASPIKAGAPPKIISTGIPVPVSTPAPMPASSPVPKPAPMPTPVPTVPKPNLAAAGWSKLTSAAVTPKPAAEPAPVIIHEDAIFKAQPARPDFHINAIRSEDLEIQKRANVIPLKPAVLELGKVPLPKPGPTPTTRVVHYDEFKEKLLASIPAPGTKGAPQRNITEITAMPKPPAPTPKPSAPPVAPSKMAEEIKVVQKDYL